MVKVAIDSGSLKSGHAVRGIGVMVKEQINAINRFGGKDIRLDAFDFSTSNQRLISNGYKIIHYPYFFPFLETLPQEKPNAKVVVTIQDLIQLVYPKNYPPGFGGTLNFLKQKKRLRDVDAIITISETSKKDICRFLDVPPEKVYVVYLAPSKIFRLVNDKKRLNAITRKYKLPRKFVFNLGDINYNKNIPTLIEACEIAGVPLVIGGKQALEIEDAGLLNLMEISGPMDYLRFLFDIPHPEHAHYEKILSKFKKSKKVLRLGYIPDSDVAEVMSLASVYCQPSYYEGFGLSVVHAFACGVPVVVSRTNALVEVADKGALVANPNDPKDMGVKIKKLLRDVKLRREMVKKGSDRLKSFSWEATAKGIVEVYKKVVGSEM